MSTVQTHTPGPWRACDSPSNFQRGKQYIRPQHSEALIATVSGEMRQTERWKNAALIAAAPDLLAALECVLKEDWNGVTRPWTAAAVAAIKKARGE